MERFLVDCRVQERRVRLRLRADRVFVTNLIGLFRATQMRVVPGETVLDVGTGGGFHAILAAKLGAGRVYGVDPNPVAIEDARNNARFNGVSDRCRFFVGSLAEPLHRRGLRADLMVSTLPNWRSGQTQEDRLMRRSKTLSRHFDSGKHGMDLSIQLIHAARTVLTPDGRLELHLVDWAFPQEGLRALKEEGFRVRELARAHIPEWGRRNNLLSWVARQKLPLRRRFDFTRFPCGRKTTARVIEANLGDSRANGLRRAARLEIRWGRLDESLKRILTSQEESE